MATFRTEETEKKYSEARDHGWDSGVCHLCSDPSIKEFAYWRIIDNLFPYDKIASTHHMLIPKRHVIEKDLTEEEKAELYSIKYGYVNDNYEFVMEVVPKGKTLPPHLHLHLLIAK